MANHGTVKTQNIENRYVKVLNKRVYFTLNGAPKEYNIGQILKYGSQGEIPDYVLEHPEVKMLLRNYFTCYES